MTTKPECTHCGAPMETRRYDHVERVGRYTVKDGTGLALHCEQCGAVELTMRDLEGYERRAAAIVLRDATVDPEVFRYARKALGLTQVKLAALLGYQPETISRWENGHEEISKAAELAMVALLEGAERGQLDLDELLSGKERASVTELVIPPLLARTGCD